MSNLNAVVEIKNVEEIELLSMSDLLAYFNFYIRPESAKVKRFADKATAVKRVTKLFLEMEEARKVEAEFESDEAFEKAMRAELAKDKLAEESKPKKEKTAREKAPRLLARIEAGEKIRLSSNSEGIAKSWDVETVKEARLTRNGVGVEYSGNRAEFKSLRVAFAELGLPDAKHIKFRGELKKEGAKTFEFEGVKYNFVILS